MEMKNFQAHIDSLSPMLELVLKQAKDIGFDKKHLENIHLAAEEALINVITYAYPDKHGDIEIRCYPAKVKSGIIIEIIDSGVPFDPLNHPEPDLSLPLEQRPIGGLGIFMIKKIMDALSYKRDNGKNIFILTKYID